MPAANNEYAEAPSTYADVIEAAIAQWTERQAHPLSIPLSNRVVGSLATLITRGLAQAGLIDATTISAET